MAKRQKKPKHNVFRSRHGTNREITQISPNTYQISGTSHYMRAGFRDNKDEGLEFADFEGGPFIQVGMEVSLFGVKDNRKVFKIEFVPTDEENYGVVRIEVA